MREVVPVAGHHSDRLKLEAGRTPGWGRGWKRPRQCRGGSALPDGSCPLAKTRRRKGTEPVLEAPSVVGDLVNLADGSLRGAGQVVACDLSASVVCEIWAAGGPGQDCDARPAAMPPGYSRTPILVGTDTSERGKRFGTALPARLPAGQGAGAMPAVGIGSWRSRRSTPSAGKLRAWGRAAA